MTNKSEKTRRPNLKKLAELAKQQNVCIEVECNGHVYRIEPSKASKENAPREPFMLM